jgi:hypothetical protein
MLLVALDVLLGAICGLVFRAVILVPLIALGCIEVAFIKGTETWGSAAWSAVTLIGTLEIGYVLGSVLAAWLPVAGDGVFRELLRRRDSRLSHH